jgi:O-antigen ligase
VSLTVLAATIALLPLLRPAGPGNTAPVDLLIGLFLFVAALGLSRRSQPLHIPAGTAILLILLGSTLALIASLDIATGLLTLVVDLYLFALFIAVANELEDERSLRVVLNVWVVSSLVWATVLIGSSQGWLPTGFQALVGGPVNSAYPRASAAAGNPNLAASYILTSCFVALVAPWPRWRFARMTVLGWLVLAMYLTGSNGAMASFLAGAGLLGLGVYLRGGRRPQEIMGLVGAAVLAGTILLGLTVSIVGVPRVGLADVDALARREQDGSLANSIGRLDHGIDERLAIWTSGWRGAAPRLAIGVGPGEAINYAVTLDGTPISLHNDLYAFLIERGILGLLGFVALHVALLRWGGRLLVSGGPHRDAMRGLGAAVVANLAFSMSHETLHFRHVWVLYAMLWAAYTIVSTRQGAASRSQHGVPAPAVHP